MDISLVKNINLNEAKGETYANVDGLSLQSMFFITHNCFPSCYIFDADNRSSNDFYFDTEKMLDGILDKYKDHTNKTTVYLVKGLSDTKPKQRLKFCIIIDDKLFCRFESDMTESYILYKNEDYEFAKEFADFVGEFFVKPKPTEDTYWRLCTSQSGYYLNKGKIKLFDDFSVDTLYNEDFKKEDTKIRDFIAEDDKSGLVILHGEKGTGKSTYIKYLVHSFPDKKFVYVPANLVNLLGDPSFGSFLTTLDNHIIVLEDCENVIQDRKSQYNASSVSLLLNLTDGILSDDLGMKFICTFNDDMKNIDSALLRKGRLISKYEFKPLCIEKATKILNDNGIEVKLTKPLPLSDIFNYGEDDYDNNTQKRNII